MKFIILYQQSDLAWNLKTKNNCIYQGDSFVKPVSEITTEHFIFSLNRSILQSIF